MVDVAFVPAPSTRPEGADRETVGDREAISRVQSVPNEPSLQPDRTSLDFRQPIHQWATALREGDVTSEELVRASLEKIRELPAAFVHLFEDTAVVQARTADIRRATGEWRGPLSGIPVAVKDMVDVAWFPTDCGIPKALQERLVNRDALIVERLRAAGAIIVGKTHCTELGLPGLGYNVNYQTLLSPFGRSRGGCAPGGSSGGSAVAVAEGLVLAAVGMDTCGSVRIPAAWCAVTGFRPTYGKIPMSGCQLLSENFDSVGTMANCVQDCALIHRVMQGNPEPAAALELHSPAALRLLVPIHGWAPWPGRKELDGPVRVAFEAALDALSAEGMTIERAEVGTLSSVVEHFNLVVSAEAAATHADLLADETRAASLDPLLREWLDVGAKVSATQYLRARAQLRKLRSATDYATLGFNAVLMPTVSMGPPVLTDLLGQLDKMREAARRCASVTRLTDALKRCAVTLPCHSPPIITHKWQEGEPVPVGLMVMGETNGDETCLAVAASIEAALRRVNLGKWRPTSSCSRVSVPAVKRARTAAW